jgi:hypothetical protein
VIIHSETGVGAAIAAGSQAEKGIWALLVIAANKTRRGNQFLNSAFLQKAQILQIKSPTDTNQAITFYCIKLKIRFTIFQFSVEGTRPSTNLEVLPQLLLAHW